MCEPLIRMPASQMIVTAEQLRGQPFWVALYGVVFDLTSFVRAHPGGAAAILELGGSDATLAFSRVHHRSVLTAFGLPDRVVGRLAGSSPPEAARLPLRSPFPHADWEGSAALAIRFVCCDGTLFSDGRPESLDDDDRLFRHRSAIGRLHDDRQWLHVSEPQTYAEEMNVRRRLIFQRPRAVFQATAGSLPAQKEALEQVLSWLTHHAPAGRFLADSTRVQTTAPGFEHEFVLADFADSPLLLAGLLVQDDLFIMMAQEEGDDTVLAAGVSCYSFDVAVKIGLSMASIHHPHVPGFSRQLQRPVERVLHALEPGTTLWRHNWMITAYRDLVHHDLPFADAVIESLHPEPPFSEGAVRSDHNSVKDLHWRVEYQTLKKLPETGAVLFTVRTYVDRMGDWEERGHVVAAQAAAAAIRRKHKGMLHYLGMGEPTTTQTILRYLDCISRPSVGGHCGTEPWERSVVDDGTWAVEADRRGNKRIKDTSSRIVQAKL